VAQSHLAFGKSEKSLMRGIILERFLSAPDDDISWIKQFDGLNEDKAAKIVGESIKWWD